MALKLKVSAVLRYLHANNTEGSIDLVKVLKNHSAAADSKQHARLGDIHSRKESRRRKSNNFSSLLNTQQQQKCDFLG